MPASEVDPGIRTLLDMINSVPDGSTRDRDIAASRASYAALPFEADIVEVADIIDRIVPGEGGGVPVRIYRAADDPVGTLVWYHGGGWVLGGLDSADRMARRIAEGAGCTVVSVDYRLAPEHPAPAAADDAWAALGWVRSTASGLGTDPDRVAVGGDSAGGYLAALVARRARDEGIALRHQLLAYPVIEPGRTAGSRETNGEGYFLTQATIEYFERSYFGTPADADSLFAADLSGLAPAHVITAGYDPLRDEGQEYAEALIAAGVQVVDDRYPTMAHLFLQMGLVTPMAGKGMERVTSLLARALK